MRQDGDGGFRVGHVVRVNDWVRPAKFANRQGVVAEVRRVVPKAIVDALHAEGKLTNNGDFEIGLDLSGADAQGPIREANAWFLPHELSGVTAVSARPHKKGPHSPSDAPGSIEGSET